MKTYAIALKRSAQRYQYIQKHLSDLGLDFEMIDAVDGSKLSEAEIEEICDMEQVRKFPWWLTPGAIGCFLSHSKSYEAIVASDDKAGFVVEDDVILPKNINQILADVKKEIRPNELILLCYNAPETCELTSQGATQLSEGQLLAPVSLQHLRSAVAYVVHRTTAQNILDKFKPISFTADNWKYHDKLGCFKHVRVLHPLVIHYQYFKSSIDYIDNKTFKGRLSNFINKYKIPPIYQYLRYKRQKTGSHIRNNFVVTDKPSPYI